MASQTRERGGRASFSPEELRALEQDRLAKDPGARGLSGDERRARGWDQDEQGEISNDGIHTLEARRARALQRDDDSAAEFVDASDLSRRARMDSGAPRTYRAETGLSYDQFRRHQYYAVPTYGPGSRDNYQRIHHDAHGIQRAAENAQRVSSTPRNYTRPDERVLDDVWNCLLTAPELDVSDVDVEVREGAVTLRGTVPTRTQKLSAEQACERAAGAQEIRNLLRVGVRSAES